MILDSFPNLMQYAALSPRLETALKLLTSGFFTQLPDGRHEMNTPGIIGILQSYRTKPHSAGRLEAHRKYLDIQTVLHGTELFGYAPIANLQPLGEFDYDKDIIFYHPYQDTQFFTLHSGTAALFFPNDGHMPGLDFTKCSGDVRKLVIKVEL